MCDIRIRAPPPTFHVCLVVTSRTGVANIFSPTCIRLFRFLGCRVGLGFVPRIINVWSCFPSSSGFACAPRLLSVCCPYRGEIQPLFDLPRVLFSDIFKLARMRKCLLRISYREASHCFSPRVISEKSARMRKCLVARAQGEPATTLYCWPPSLFSDNVCVCTGVIGSITVWEIVLHDQTFIIDILHLICSINRFRTSQCLFY